jgi:hypothetical protein
VVGSPHTVQAADPSNSAKKQLHNMMLMALSSLPSASRTFLSLLFDTIQSIQRIQVNNSEYHDPGGSNLL